jgi:hypothetical protein
MNLDYNTRLATIQRNEKLAEIMRQQAFQPIEVQSYQGIQAPISPLSGLAKVLQAYMGARGTGDEERIKLNQEAKTEAQQMLSGLQDRPASPGRAAVMGMPEIQAQPASSFTPMGSDFEDNPNLQVAPSGNVETPAVPYQPAVAPQAAIPPQAAVSLDPDQKRAKLVEIMMGQNPYASPVAKLEYERLGKESQGPLAEYKFARDFQGYKGTLQEFKQSMRPLPSVTNVNMPAGAPIAVMRGNKQVFVQMGKDGKYVEVEGISPVQKDTDLRQKLADAGIFPTLEDGTPNPDYQKYAKALIERETTLSFAPSTSVKDPLTGKITQTAPTPEKGTVNVFVDGVTTAIPIADFNRLNAERIKSETRASEDVKNEFEFVTVDNPDGKGGKILMSKSAVAKKEAAGTPVVSEADKKIAQGRSVLELANEAKKYLPQASSGAISKLFTLATDAFGVPTNKSAADAQLNVISAGLTSNVPRFEGPQGVADVVLYKQAASDVGNANLPYQTRLNALNVVIDLNKKYAATPETRPPGSVRRITPK